MSNNLFNKSRYFELLQSEPEDSSSVEASELLSYRVILENQITFNNRYRYIELVEELLEEITNESWETDLDIDLDIDLETDSANFKISELLDKDSEDFNLLENKIRKEGIAILDNFPIDSKAGEFLDLILYLHRYDWDWDTETIENLDNTDKDHYRISIELALSNLRDYANSASRTSKEKH